MRPSVLTGRNEVLGLNVEHEDTLGHTWLPQLIAWTFHVGCASLVFGPSDDTLLWLLRGVVEIWLILTVYHYKSDYSNRSWLRMCAPQPGRQSEKLFGNQTYAHLRVSKVIKADSAGSLSQILFLAVYDTTGTVS
jgi:hypothetical protein